jgi:hypothetical protein
MTRHSKKSASVQGKRERDGKGMTVVVSGLEERKGRTGGGKEVLNNKPRRMTDPQARLGSA